MHTLDVTLYGHILQFCAHHSFVSVHEMSTFLHLSSIIRFIKCYTNSLKIFVAI